MATPLTAAQLAVALDVTTETVSEWAKAGLIPCSQIGRRRYFVLDDVLAATRRPVRLAPRLVLTEQEDDEIQEAREFFLGPQARPAVRHGKRKAQSRG